MCGTSWERTAAYHLERTLSKLELGRVCRFLPLGRGLTRRMGRKKHGIKGCEAWFLPDGVHLSYEGYAKIADAGRGPYGSQSRKLKGSVSTVLVCKIFIFLGKETNA